MPRKRTFAPAFGDLMNATMSELGIGSYVSETCIDWESLDNDCGNLDGSSRDSCAFSAPLSGGDVKADMIQFLNYVERDCVEFDRFKVPGTVVSAFGESDVP